MIIEFIIVILVGLCFGIIVGLLPGLPSYITPMLAMPMAFALPIDLILIFWITSLIGSQYFGSVSSILLRVPGETSSMIYLNDLKNMSFKNRLDLIRQTAIGSSIGSIFTLTILMCLYYTGLSEHFVIFLRTEIKFMLFLTVAAMLVISTNGKALKLFLFVLGLTLCEKSGLGLPSWMITVNEYSRDITVFTLVLAFIIIPGFLSEIIKNDKNLGFNREHGKTRYRPLRLGPMMSGSIIGSTLGMLPGPGHVTSGVMAYRMHDSRKNKIIAAETANNSAVIATMLPFLFIGLPLGIGEFILYDIMQLKALTLPNFMFEPWRLNEQITLMEMLFGVSAVSILIYLFLAQKFLSFYESIVTVMYKKLWLLFVLLIAFLISVDIHFSFINTEKYIIYLSILTLLGTWVHHKQIDTLPLIFGFVLGDQMMWSGIQIYFIHFS